MLGMLQITKRKDIGDIVASLTTQIIKRSYDFMANQSVTHNSGKKQKNNFKDITDNRLLILKEIGKNKHGHRLLECLCECGSIIIVRKDHLQSGHTRSCGCLVKDMAKKTHTKHGMRETFAYSTWRMMIQRCHNSNNPAFEFYGGRGIQVCKRWLKFESFLEDMGERTKELSIERRNNELGYYKENCYWATRTTQSRNKRVQKRNGTGVTGVRWDKKIQKYFSSVGLNRKRISLGYFSDIDDAIKARKAGELKYWNKIEVQNGT